jgi:succinate dehydrogenase hydrophobic anchor subunit
MMLFLQMSFAGVEEKPLGKGFAALVRKLAPHTLAVYLIHENIGLRYVWQNCFLANRVNSVFGLFLGTVVAVFCVFACGILVDCFRALLVKLCYKALSHVALYNKVLRLIEGLDEKCKRG